MEKRTILAFVLMAVVLVVSQLLLTPPAPEEDAAGTGAAPAGTAEQDRGAAAGDAPRPAPVVAPEAVAPSPPRQVGGAGAFASPGGPLVRVETPLYALDLARRGGVLTAVWLRRYESFIDSMPVQLVPPGGAFLHKTIRSDAGTVDLTALEFASERDTVQVGAAPDSVVLTATAADGSPVRQVFRFDPGSYEIGYRFEAPGLARGGPVLETRLGPRLRSHEVNPEEDLGSFRAVARVAEEVHTLEPDDVEEPAVLQGPVSWAGIKSKYFLGVLLRADRSRSTSWAFFSGPTGRSARPR